MLRHRAMPLAAAVLLATACQELPNAPDTELAPAFATRGGDPSGQIQRMLDDMNVTLAAEDADYRALMAEYITHYASDQAGTTVIAKNVGNKQLGADFVPNDPRRTPWSGPVGGENDDITYAIDQTGDAVPPLGGLTAAETDAAIVRAMETWEDVRCSDLVLTRNPDFGVDIGLAAFQSALGGSPFILADIQHAGWEIDFAGGVLGITITFVFVDGGNTTDIDNDGKTDVAFREIYYDTGFPWADNGVNDIDLESVAVHEAGHGLSQAHFGSVQIQDRGRNGLFLKASPRAVMNALYSEPFRELTGSDNGGHCSIWSDWPES